LHQYASPVRRINLTARQIEIGKAIQSARYCRFRNIKLLRQAANGVGAFIEIACEEDTELPSGKIDAIAPDQRNNGIAQHTH
jgi:hypothetical protein